MSFTRLDYDACTYEHNLRQSSGTGDYWLQTPSIECMKCFPGDPSINAQQSGVAKCANRPLVDLDSELMGLTRKASNCPKDKYVPSAQPFCQTDKLRDCRAIPREETRLSNPPCTLRCTGWNRWEWLCQNPQANVLAPFDFNISNRIVVKDNHRPCVPTPLSPIPILPPSHFDGDNIIQSFQSGQSAQSFTTSCGYVNSDPPSTAWRQRCDYAAYAL